MAKTIKDPKPISVSPEQLDYEAVLQKYPWIITKDQDCILSPDTDGLLCGLFMSHYLNWKVRGFYDGKVLLIEKGFTMQKCVFLDMEIFRKDVRSLGQHMVMYNRNRIPENWSEFDNAISANNLRNFDVCHAFKEKYPFGAIHLLMALVGHRLSVKVPTSAICPMLYADGTFKSLFNYPENCLSWLRFLNADQEKHLLHGVFFNDHYSISQLMRALRDLFDEFKKIGGGKRGGDKIKISNKDGKPINLDAKQSGLQESVRMQSEMLLAMLGEKTGWLYNHENWTWDNYGVQSFKKGSVKPGLARYNELMKKNPLSLAVISGNSIEYTLE